MELSTALTVLFLLCTIASSTQKTLDARSKRSPDGGHVKFIENERDGRGLFRSGGRGPQLYSGACDNSGYSCGVPSSSFDLGYSERLPRVRGGECKDTGAVPWTVQIQVKEYDHKRYTHRCGGSLIADQYVLTARHCFGGIAGKDILVILGQNQFKNKADPGEVAFQVEKYWLHEDFQKQGPYSHDIALLKLKPKGDGCGARYTQTVSPICLPDPWSTFSENTTCIVSGWGKTKTYDSIHGECLRAATLPIMSHKQCKKIYANSSQRIIKEMLCAGRLEGGVDACKGDSGGPLVCKQDPNDDHYILAGVVSWGLGCGKAHTPGVFTNVVHYLDWIQEKMEEDF